MSLVTISELSFKIPLFSSAIQAGFPSPAYDYAADPIDLNRYIITNPTATFFAKVEGDSMKNAGIFHGSFVVVDKSLKANKNDIVVAVVDGDFTIKRLGFNEENVILIPENDSYPILEIREGREFRIWGVVTWVFSPSNVCHS